MASLLAASAVFTQTPPGIPFDSGIDFLKLPAEMNFGEVLGIAIDSKGHIVVLNHPGSSTSGPDEHHYEGRGAPPPLHVGGESRTNLQNGAGR